MATTVARIQERYGTAASWVSSNPTLAAGEIGVETNTGFMKLGDGSTAWTSLKYTRSPETITVVRAGSNLSTARPVPTTALVYWIFDAGVDPGASGENVVNGQPADLFAVLDA